MQPFHELVFELSCLRLPHAQHQRVYSLAFHGGTALCLIPANQDQGVIYDTSPENIQIYPNLRSRQEAKCWNCWRSLPAHL